MLRSYENYERYQSERDHHFQVDHCGTLCLVTTWPCIHQQIIFNKNSQHGLISYFFIGKRIYPFFYLFSYTSVFFFFVLIYILDFLYFPREQNFRPIILLRDLRLTRNQREYQNCRVARVSLVTVFIPIQDETKIPRIASK